MLFFLITRLNSIFSSHHLRAKTDLQYYILFIYYTIESPNNRNADKPYYKHIIREQEPVVGYYSMGKKYKSNAINLQNCIKDRKKFNCINDNLMHENDIGR